MSMEKSQRRFLVLLHSLYSFSLVFWTFFMRGCLFYFLLCQILTIYQNQERGKKGKKKELRRKVESGKCLTVVLFFYILVLYIIEGWRKQKKRERITESISQYIFRNSCVIKVISKINISFTSFFIISHIQYYRDRSTSYMANIHAHMTNR